MAGGNLELSFSSFLFLFINLVMAASKDSIIEIRIYKSAVVIAERNFANSTVWSTWERVRIVVSTTKIRRSRESWNYQFTTYLRDWNVHLKDEHPTEEGYSTHTFECSSDGRP